MEASASDRIGLVLAGGGARGAYEIGALSKLLPRIAADEGGRRPEVIVGTSVGAINASYLAATADQDLESSLDTGRELWERLMRPERVVRPNVVKAFLKTFLDAIDVPGQHAEPFLTVEPLEEALLDAIPLDRIEPNVDSGLIHAAAVAATLSSTSLSQVFYCGSAKLRPEDDPRRGIRYMRTKLGIDHVLASAAIPGIFPSRKVRGADGKERWYVDGGTRLNTPISPAIELEAGRVIVIALNDPRLARFDEAQAERHPEVLDAATHVMQAVLVDPLVNDLYTLTRINRLVKGRPPDGEREIPYILVAPNGPNAIGRIAVEVFEDCYGKGDTSRLGLLGNGLDVPGDPVRGELFSHLFFDEEFARRLIRQGRKDAENWIQQADAGLHERGLWRVSDPLPVPEPAGVS
jgi:NTE family protein